MTKTPTHKQNQVKDEIDRLLTEMKNQDIMSDEYEALMDKLEKLYKVRKDETSTRISRDALIAAGANIAGIVMILKFEQANVIATKALGFVIKSKL